MTENDLKLLAVVLRAARELAEDCNSQADGCFDDDICPPSGESLLDALDQFKFKASFAVPE